MSGLQWSSLHTFGGLGDLSFWDMKTNLPPIRNAYNVPCGELNRFGEHRDLKNDLPLTRTAYYVPRGEFNRFRAWPTVEEVAENITSYKSDPFAYLDYIGENFAFAQTSDNVEASNVSFTILADGRNLKHPYPRTHTHAIDRQSK